MSSSSQLHRNNNEPASLFPPEMNKHIKAVSVQCEAGIASAEVKLA